MDNSSGAVDRERFEAARKRKNFFKYFEEMTQAPQESAESIYRRLYGKQEPELFTEADYGK